MRRLAAIVGIVALLAAPASLAQPPPAGRAKTARPKDAGPPPPPPPGLDEGWWHAFRTSIEKHLGRPYVWGACGLKSFDCSGFVWRVLQDNDVLIKRTTARRLYFLLPKVPDDAKFAPGNIVFFDNLTHCGIVNDEKSFFHAQVSRGTTLAPMNRFWSAKVCGFRAVPVPKGAPAPAPPPAPAE